MIFEIPDIIFWAIRARIFNVVENNCDSGPQNLSNAEADKQAKEQK